MPLGIDFLQILLHLFNVVLLFGGLYILLYAPVKKFMKKREDHYASMAADAENALADAEKMKAEYEDKLRGAQEEIAAHKKKVMSEIEENRMKETKQAKREARKIIEEARQDAEKQRNAIIADARDEISEIISEAAEKLMMGESEGDIYDAFLEGVERSAENGGK